MTKIWRSAYNEQSLNFNTSEKSAVISYFHSLYQNARDYLFYLQKEDELISFSKQTLGLWSVGISAINRLY